MGASAKIAPPSAKKPGSPKKRKASQIAISTAERPDGPRLKAGAQRIAADLEWTAQQYAKYEVFRQEQKEAREANM
jgi:hypothetical protein